MITGSSTDAQVPSAKAVYYYVQNVRGRLAASLAEHQHTYLCAWGSERIVAAPAVDEDGTIVPDAALAPAFDAEAFLHDLSPLQPVSRRGHAGEAMEAV